MRNGDRDAVKDLYEELLNDDDLLKQFTVSVRNACGSDVLSDVQHTEVWRYVVTKTYHARIGVVTDRFADQTAGCYAALATTDPLQAILKITTRQTTINKVKRKTKTTTTNTDNSSNNTSMNTNI